LILKKLQISEDFCNKFYLEGGEKIKLGRVLLKVIEVSREHRNPDDRGDMLSDSHNTEISLNQQNEEADLNINLEMLDEEERIQRNNFWL
jgi:hypothetical protein